MMEYATLNELCTIQSGGTPSRSQREYWSHHEIPWLKISDMKEKYISTAEEYISEEGLRNSSAKIFPEGTILYTIFATLGEVGILKINAATNQAIAGLTIKSNKIQKEYLYYYLKSMKEKVTRMGRGVAQNNINMSILKEFTIPLYSLDKQTEIVSKLLSIENLLSNRQNVLSLLDQLIKSRFVEMFGNPNLDNVLYEKKAIEDICDSIYGGGTPSKSHKEYYTGDIPWITPKDMKTLSINDSQDHITTEAIKNSTTKIIPPKSVLMVIRSGILKHTLPIAINNVEVTINQDMKAFLPSKIIMPEYLLYTFRMLESSILSKVRAVTADNIEFGELRKRQIPVPPIALQNQFADFVAHADKSKVTVLQSIDTLQTLKDKLMQKYFGFKPSP